jgi:predicted lipid carrier protein YhbT
LRAARLRRVQAAFASMPERFVGGAEGLDAAVQVRLGDIGRAWEVRLESSRCRVNSTATREPDVVIGTDSATWLALREGRMSGVDAFSRRRLYARGDLDLALAFEGFFHLPGGRAPLLRAHEVRVEGATISTLTAGAAPSG